MKQRFRFGILPKYSVKTSRRLTYLYVGISILILAGVLGILTTSKSAPENDDLIDAIELTDLNNWCSDEAEFSTLGGTPDENEINCTNKGSAYNVWFKFKATTKNITIDLKTGDSEGSLRNGFIILYDDENREIACARYVQPSSDITISHNSLTPGEWYYISVDNLWEAENAYWGSFTLCIRDQIDYDWKEAAFELPNLNMWTSEEAQFSTLWATSDEKKGASWQNGPNFNRWFTFKAISREVRIQVRIGGTEGTLRYPYASLWDSVGTELIGVSYKKASSDLDLEYNDLTPGKRYYLSVDNHNDGSEENRGTFTLYIDATTNLPIELLSFNGEVEKNTVHLRWVTGKEVNNDFFTLERSFDGKEFVELGEVPGAGNSDTQREYEFYDPAPMPGVNIYQLKQTDLDGSFSYSSRVEIQVDEQKRVSSVRAFPNPFKEHINISFFSNGTGKFKFSLLDGGGKLVDALEVAATEGENRHQWTFGQHLPPGLYILNVSKNGQAVQSLRLIHR